MYLGFFCCLLSVKAKPGNRGKDQKILRERYIFPPSEGHEDLGEEICFACKVPPDLCCRGRLILQTDG